MPTKDELEKKVLELERQAKDLDEKKLAYKFFIAEKRYGLFTTTVKASAVVAIFFCGYLSVKEFAGKTTAYQMGVNILGSVTVSEAIAWALAAMTGGGFYVQREAKKKVSKELVRTKKAIGKNGELSLSTSGLSEIGETPNDS